MQHNSSFLNSGRERFGVLITDKSHEPRCDSSQRSTTGTVAERYETFRFKKTMLSGNHNGIAQLPFLIPGSRLGPEVSGRIGPPTEAVLQQHGHYRYQAARS